DDQLLGVVGTVPAADLDPLARLEVLVVLEEVLDLLEGDLRQIGVLEHLLIAAGELRDRNGDDLLVLAAIIFHHQHADRADVDDAARDERAGVADQNVNRVAVVRQGVRDEAVITRVGHRGVEEAVDDERAGFLVHLVLDRLSANRDLDDDVDVFWRILANGDGFDTHFLFPDRLENARRRVSATRPCRYTDRRALAMQQRAAGDAGSVPLSVEKGAIGDRRTLRVRQFQTKATLRSASVSNTSTPSATSRPPAPS